MIRTMNSFAFIPTIMMNTVKGVHCLCRLKNLRMPPWARDWILPQPGRGAVLMGAWIYAYVAAAAASALVLLSKAIAQKVGHPLTGEITSWLHNAVVLSVEAIRDDVCVLDES
jgi:hypothetical protein